jgi:hypothetical protein
VGYGKRAARRAAVPAIVREPAGGFFGMDVLVSSAVLVVFMRMERKRLAIRFPWLPIVGLCAVGVSFGLPLFLHFRESALEAIEQAAGQTRAAKS